MGFRDLALFLILAGGIPFMVRDPAIGVMFWVWISLMNPHRQAYGYAYAFPFAMVVALFTIVGLVVSKAPKQFKGGGAAIALLLFVVWTCVTTAFALDKSAAVPLLERTLKIQLFTFISLWVLYKREHAIALITTMVLSIGYYGVKGGIFVLATAGNYRVWGPADSFIEDNNSLALAVVMSIPLWAYLYYVAKRRWLKVALAAAIGLSGVAAVGSFSRGAMLAIGAALVLLWWRGRQKVLLGAALIALGVSVVTFMPSKWEERMETIKTYEEDSSAQGRINTWIMLFNLAADRPLVGGGFAPYTKEIFEKYNPEYDAVHVAHSIYFSVLGEQGYIGLFFWLMLWILTWRTGSQIRQMCKNRPEEAWAFWLASMIQVSLAAYFVGGAFLSLAYWDMPYYLFVALAVTQYAVVKAREGSQVPAGQPTGTTKLGTAGAS
jgi:probable O-glycosylation ligase (exosortase A-associated)